MRAFLLLFLVWSAFAAEPVCKPAWRAVGMMQEYRDEDRGLFGRVKYLRTEAERTPYVAKIENGKFVDHVDVPLQTRWRWYQWLSAADWFASGIANLFGETNHAKSIIVLSKDGKLYVGSPRFRRFHHSSFLAGDDVLFAGEARFVDGKLVYLSNFSGHYRTPYTQYENFKKWLQERGVDLSDATVLDAYR